MKPALSFKALFGSHNYKLNRPDSDEDTMCFYVPSFRHLFDGKMASDDIKDQNPDRKHHDVRKLPTLFYKANVNFLEILFSCKVEDHDGLYERLVAHREEIAAMNIPYLYNGCMGMFRRNLKNLHRDAAAMNGNVEDSQNVACKLGKHAGSAFRILDFVQRYASLGFKDFQQAISYDPDANKDKKFRVLYMAMRDGWYEYEDLCEILRKKEEEVTNLEPYYKEQKPREDVNKFVVSTVRNHVKEIVATELLNEEALG